jgi:tryptophanyl-tRNA synthetase
MRVPSRVLSGVQPSGALHLGNYLGALVKFTRLQHEIDTFIFVADLHAITVWQDPALLAQQTREIAAAYIASGLDPDKATIFPQSAVREHAELAWIFQCVARLGWLDRMTQFKEKSGKHKERSSVGLYTYPVLQAADILVYKATHVPVGEDQKQHLELTRDIAAKFNHDFGVPGLLPAARPADPGAGRAGHEPARRHGQDEQVRPVGQFAHQPDRRRRHHRRQDQEGPHRPGTAARDPGRADRPRRGRQPGRHLRGPGRRTKAEVLADYAGKGFGTFKPALAELAVETLAPVGDKMRGLLADPAVLDAILAKGAARPPRSPLRPWPRSRSWSASGGLEVRVEAASVAS